MKKLIIIMTVILLPFSSLFAQEKTVNDLTVKLGVLSWEEIQTASLEKPAVHTEDFHRKMARSMAKMHGGGTKGDYHVMIVLTDETTGKAVKHADVMVKAVAKAGPEEITHSLQRMSMDGFYGYGEFYRLTFPGPYVFEIEVEKGYRTYKAEFERTIQ
jgi:hypothetical protein